MVEMPGLFYPKTVFYRFVEGGIDFVGGENWLKSLDHAVFSQQKNIGGCARAVKSPTVDRLLGRRVEAELKSNSDKSSGRNDYVVDPTFWRNGQALGFPIEVDQVLKHLRQDMRDDWYYDCLQYDDLFNNPEETKRTIVSLLQEWNGIYRGTTGQ